MTNGPSASVEWRDEFRVGVEEIDDQHRRLIDMLAKFYEALAEKKQAKEALGQLLKGLLDYTRYHFSTEERLMQRMGFPKEAAHKEQHAAFVAKATDMADRFARGRLILSIEATVFIREWLFSHILVTDKELGRHLTTHGEH